MSTPVCPTCGAPAATEHAPFCSSRCADIDLHRWLSGSYKIAASDDDESPDLASEED